jgi:2-methylcitrate dehydratase PrpD
MHAARLLNRYLDTGTTMAAALYSLPYNIATALLDKQYSLAQLDDAHRADPAVVELARRVAIVSDEAMTRRYPETTPAEVVITYRDGTRVRHLQELPPGDPRRETPDAAIFDKFDLLAVPVLGTHQALSLREQLMTIDDCDDIGRVLAALRPLLY